MELYSIFPFTIGLFHWPNVPNVHPCCSVLQDFLPFKDECKEIEENNRMGKTRDLFKKIRDTKGTFHAKMGSIKAEMVWT